MELAPILAILDTHTRKCKLKHYTNLIARTSSLAFGQAKVQEGGPRNEVATKTARAEVTVK